MAKTGMSKGEVSKSFAELSESVYRMRGPNKGRFIPMVQKRNDRLYEFGMYDYKTKRYVLECIHSSDAENALNEIKAMLDKA